MRPGESVDTHDSKESRKASCQAQEGVSPQDPNTTPEKPFSEVPKIFLTKQNQANNKTKARKRYGSVPSVDAKVTSTGVLRARCRFNPRRDDLQTFLDEISRMKSTAQKLFKIHQHVLQVEELSKTKKGVAK